MTADKPVPFRLAEWIALLLADNPDPVTLGVLHATADGARVGVQTTDGDCTVVVAGVGKAGEFLRCPFCGDSGAIYPQRDNYWKAKCRGCNVLITDMRSIDEAIAAWNRRA